jgi:hypothetical protein
MILQFSLLDSHLKKCKEVCMDFGTGVEAPRVQTEAVASDSAQMVQTEAAALENAQSLSRANQDVLPMTPSTSASSSLLGLGFPDLSLFAPQTDAASGWTQSFGPNLGGGRTLELSPPGAPFSFQMFVPDNVGPHALPRAQGDGTQPNMIPNAQGDGTQPNMIPNAPGDRRLPNAKPDITFDDVHDAPGAPGEDPDAIRSHRSNELPNKKGSALDGAAKDLGLELLRYEKGERLLDMIRNHRRRYGRNKL